MSITDGNGTTIEPIGGWRILANSTDRKTINLDAAPAEVRKVSIEDTVGDAGSNNVTINASGSQQIDGSDSIVLDVDYQRKVLKSTGTGWTVVATAVDGVNSRDTLTVSADTIEVRNEYTFPTADGTDGQVLKTDGNGTLSWQDDSQGSGSTEVVTYSNDVRMVDNTYNSGYQGDRSYTLRRHVNYTEVDANQWHDIISWRPYMTGSTDEPASNTFWGTVSFRSVVSGHQHDVTNGNGYHHRLAAVYYQGSSAADASSTDTTHGIAPVQCRVLRSGWVTTVQFNANATGATKFTGMSYVEVHFAPGAGQNAERVVWDVT